MPKKNFNIDRRKPNTEIEKQINAFKSGGKFQLKSDNNVKYLDADNTSLGELADAFCTLCRILEKKGILN